MKNNKYIPLILLLVSVSTIAFLYGCGSVTSGGGGGGGSAGSPWIYVGNADVTNPSIMIIDGSTNTTIEPIDLGDNIPYSMAAAPNGTKIYCSTGTDEVLIIDTTGNSIEGSFTVVNSKHSSGMVVSHDNKFLYMTGTSTNEFFKIYLNGSYTYETAALDAESSRIALNSDSTKAYVCVNCDGNPADTRLNAVNLQTMTVESLSLLNKPHDLLVKDGYLYVTMHSLTGNLAIIKMSDFSIVDEIVFSPARDYWGIVNVPGTNKLYLSKEIDAGEVHIATTSPGTIEFGSKIITGESFTYPGFMAATTKYVYVVDAPSVDKVVAINVASNSIESYITGLDSQIYYCNPVVVYK